MLVDEFDERFARRCFQLLKVQKSCVLVYRAQIKAFERAIEIKEVEPWTKELRTKVNARFVKAGDQDRDNDD